MMYNPLSLISGTQVIRRQREHLLHALTMSGLLSPVFVFHTTEWTSGVGHGESSSSPIRNGNASHSSQDKPAYVRTTVNARRLD